MTDTTHSTTIVCPSCGRTVATRLPDGSVRMRHAGVAVVWWGDGYTTCGARVMRAGRYQVCGERVAFAVPGLAVPGYTLAEAQIAV